MKLGQDLQRQLTLDEEDEARNGRQLQKCRGQCINRVIANCCQLYSSLWLQLAAVGQLAQLIMELAWSLGSQVRGVSARNGAYLNVAPNQDQAGINQGQFDDRGYIKKVV